MSNNVNIRNIVEIWLVDPRFFKLIECENKDPLFCSSLDGDILAEKECRDNTTVRNKCKKYCGLCFDLGK